MTFVNYKGYLWTVKYIGNGEVSKDEMELVKKRSNTDMCLRKGGKYYYVDIIEDIDYEIVED